MAKKKPGRPKAVTPQVKRNIIRFLADGGSKRMAAEAAGVSRAAFAAELRIDAKFRADVRKAIASRFIKFHQHLNKQLENATARQTAAILKILYPDEYQTKSQKTVEHRGKVKHEHGGRIDVQQLFLAFDERRAEIETTARTLIEGGDAGGIRDQRQQ